MSETEESAHKVTTTKDAPNNLYFPFFPKSGFRESQGFLGGHLENEQDDALQSMVHLTLGFMRNVSLLFSSRAL